MSIALHACHKSSRADVLMNAPQPGNYTHYLIKPQDERAPGLVFFFVSFLSLAISMYICCICYISINTNVHPFSFPSINPSMHFSPIQPTLPSFLHYIYTVSGLHLCSFFSRLLSSRTHLFGADEIIAEWLKSITFPRRD